MTKTRIVQDGIKNSEPLERVFHMLFTKTMYAEIENHSTNLKISKGAIIRSAVERYLRNLDANRSVDIQEQNHSKNQKA